MNAEDDPTECCGAPLRLDLEWEGTTCGGLDVVGGLVCNKCGQAYLCHRTHSREVWKISGGGRSMDVGAMRVRSEKGGKADDVQALFQRLVRLPELERALRAIAKGAPDARELARATLGDPAPPCTCEGSGVCGRCGRTEEGVHV